MRAEKPAFGETRFFYQGELELFSGKISRSATPKITNERSRDAADPF